MKAALLSPLLLLLSSSFVLAIETTQTVRLAAGWNAIWLEVDPVHLTGDRAGTGKPIGDVFNDAAIEIVACPVKPFGSVEFVTDSNEGFFNRSGWRIWRRTSELDANTLDIIRGYKAYLIKSTATVDLSVTGTARYTEPVWQPRAYNLLGYGLTGSVTFGQFFGDVSTTHPISRIFQLNPANGHWEGVRASDVMVSGRAYWIYCDGKSDFSGPVKVQFPGLDGMDFLEGPASVALPDPQNNAGTISVNLRELVLTNISNRAQQVTLAKAIPSSGASSLNDALRVFDVAPTPGSLSYQPGAGLLNNTPYNVPSLSTTTATLGAHRNWSSGNARRENLYRLEFEHHYVWLPMAASNASLSDSVLGSADPASVGLWVGEVLLNEVSSLTEDGNPMAPTTSTSAMRLMIHVDDSGHAHLLSHVMFMRSKTANLSVVPEDVLLLNEAKIPFFEGIQERGGKRVGLRLESTSYDMPRDLSTEGQSAILTDVAKFKGYQDPMTLEPDPSQVSDADVEEYVHGLSSDDPAPTETYHHKWPLAGSLGLNAVAQTGAKPLRLDPLHRSNPFRHVFHPQHGTGKSLSRSMELQFDDSGSATVLRGTYLETITGLAAMPIKMKGSLILERVSTTATLVE